MSRPRCVTIPRAMGAWMVVAAAAGVAGLPASAAASPCLDLAACLDACAGATCRQSCAAGADAETRELLRALVDCSAVACPPGSAEGCQYRFCPVELLACRGEVDEAAARWTTAAGPAQPGVEPSGSDVEVPFTLQGGMFSVGFGYARAVDHVYESYGTQYDLVHAFLLAYGIGWDGNWLVGSATSATVFNAGLGFDLDLRFAEDYQDLTLAAYAYFHYFFPNDLTDGVWTFPGVGLYLEAGKGSETGKPFFTPQATVAFRWLTGYTMHVEGFVGPELWFVDGVDVGVTAGVRFSVGFQVGVGRL